MTETITDRVKSRWSAIRVGCLAAAFALLGVSHTGHAQEEGAEWYQVEVIIFERLDGNRTDDPEAWPKDIDLSYPSNWQKLIPADEAAEIVATMQHDVDDLIANGEPADLTAEPLPPVLHTGEETELAFVLLPETERTLNESTGGIARARSTRVLFHEAWRQPVLGADEAPSIIIRGGNTYGDHTELEGSLRLTVSRYLHLYTDLWLTQFIPNYGQQSEHWPPLPAVPEREQQPLQNDLVETDFGKQKSPWDIETPLLDDYTSLINEPFLIKQIVTMHQARRMRSGELHYIDHPRFGLLIKVDTYTPESAEDRDESTD